MIKRETREHQVQRPIVKRGKEGVLGRNVWFGGECGMGMGMVVLLRTQVFPRTNVRLETPPAGKEACNRFRRGRLAIEEER